MHEALSVLLDQPAPNVAPTSMRRLSICALDLESLDSHE